MVSQNGAIRALSSGIGFLPDFFMLLVATRGKQHHRSLIRKMYSYITPLSNFGSMETFKRGSIKVENQPIGSDLSMHIFF